eukprot:Filipodium_phascolosomae@DN124_c0_g1_i2.p1
MGVDVENELVEDFVRYFYGRSLEVTEQNFAGILELALHFRVGDILEQLGEVATSIITKSSFQRIWKLYDVATQTIKNALLDHVADNYSEYAQTEVLAEMPPKSKALIARILLRQQRLVQQAIEDAKTTRAEGHSNHSNITIPMVDDEYMQQKWAEGHRNHPTMRVSKKADGWHVKSGFINGVWNTMLIESPQKHGKVFWRVNFLAGPLGGAIGIADINCPLSDARDSTSAFLWIPKGGEVFKAGRSDGFVRRPPAAREFEICLDMTCSKYIMWVRTAGTCVRAIEGIPKGHFYFVIILSDPKVEVVLTDTGTVLTPLVEVTDERTFKSLL